MPEHDHCWHACTNTPAGETPYAQQCCWCGQQMIAGQLTPPSDHGPYKAVSAGDTINMEADINAALGHSFSRRLVDELLR